MFRGRISHNPMEPDRVIPDCPRGLDTQPPRSRVSNPSEPCFCFAKDESTRTVTRGEIVLAKRNSFAVGSIQLFRHNCLRARAFKTWSASARAVGEIRGDNQSTEDDSCRRLRLVDSLTETQGWAWQRRSFRFARIRRKAGVLEDCRTSRSSGFCRSLRL